VVTTDDTVVPEISHEEGGFTRTLSEIKLGASNIRRPITSGPIKKNAYKLPQNNNFNQTSFIFKPDDSTIDRISSA